MPFPTDLPWPPISVVVCSYNGARTIRDCCEGLQHLDYPDYEVIVVDDGSTDNTAGIAREYGYRVISTENRGLSAARNTGPVGAIAVWHWLSEPQLAFGSQEPHESPHTGSTPHCCKPQSGTHAVC